MNLQFQGKYVIKGRIVCETGMHIGGTTDGIEIGGVDLLVIRDSLTERPYVPGSSLKGKLRHLLEWELNKVFEEGDTGKFPAHTCENAPEVKKLKKEARNLPGDETQNRREEMDDKIRELTNSCPICLIFGASAATAAVTPTRLTVRDSLPTGHEDPEHPPKDSTLWKWKKWLDEKTYTELKIENTIDRVTSEANPRTMEQVPAGSEFEFEMIFDVYRDDDRKLLKDLFTSMELLENSSLGGGGTRGHGKIRFEFARSPLEYRSVDYYKTGKPDEKKDNIVEALAEASTVRQLLERFPTQELKTRQEES